MTLRDAGRSAMRRAGRVPGAALAASLALAAVVTAGATRESASGGAAAHAAQAPGPFGHLRYADSLSSVNDRCVVTHNRLNPEIHPLYVNGRPVGFC